MARGVFASASCKTPFTTTIDIKRSRHGIKKTPTARTTTQPTTRSTTSTPTDHCATRLKCCFVIEFGGKITQYLFSSFSIPPAAPATAADPDALLLLLLDYPLNLFLFCSIGSPLPLMPPPLGHNINIKSRIHMFTQFTDCDAPLMITMPPPPPPSTHTPSR